jgi:hypothetical protein
MAAIDFTEFNKEILSSNEFIIAAREEATKVLEKQKEQLIKEFNESAVTQEIEAGPTATNKSGTLGGKGNLFSFIGFDESDNPIAPVRQLLNSIQLGAVKSKNTAKGIIEFNIEMPSEEDFEAVTKMPWENGRSWLFDIERTISGLGQYIYGRFNNSRSGTGLEVSNKNTPLAFSPTAYFKTMLEKFKKNLK